MEADRNIYCASLRVPQRHTLPRPLSACPPQPPSPPVSPPVRTLLPLLALVSSKHLLLRRHLRRVLGVDVLPPQHLAARKAEEVVEAWEPGANS